MHQVPYHRHPLPHSLLVIRISYSYSSELTSLPAAIRVTIEITYNPPDDYPASYSPPNYRTATSVSLRCVATGAIGYTTFWWSSTCRSDCFAYSTSISTYSSSYTISESFLRLRDAGVHTCTVTDGDGNTGSNMTTMNIVGGLSTRMRDSPI